MACDNGGLVRETLVKVEHSQEPVRQDLSSLRAHRLEVAGNNETNAGIGVPPTADTETRPTAAYDGRIFVKGDCRHVVLYDGAKKKSKPNR
ncbi:hypothetical protein Trydic_g3841 [Trypoxylus dichotomus]